MKYPVLGNLKCTYKASIFTISKQSDLKLNTFN